MQVETPSLAQHIEEAPKRHKQRGQILMIYGLCAAVIMGFWAGD